MQTLTQRFQRLSPWAQSIVGAAAPALAVLIYFLALSPSIYESETKVIVRQSRDATEALMPGLASSLLGVGTTSSRDDGHILAQYIASAEFIELADQRLNLREHFSAPKLAVFDRLRRDAPRDVFYAYIRKKITVKVDDIAGIISIHARAFSPEIAKELAALTLEQSEVALNHLNERMVRAQTKLAEQTLAQSQEQLMERRRELLTFQTEHSLVSPATELGSRMATISGLEARLVQLQAEVRAKSQYLQSDAFELKAAFQEIKALEEQRTAETAKLINSGDKSMAALLLTYEDIKMQAEFALQTNSSAFALLEKAKMEAARQEKFLLLISAPFVPEEPIGPRPLLYALIVVLVGLVLMGISRLIVATVQDHTI